MKQVKLMTGTSNPELAKKVAAKLGTPLADVTVGRFSDGEIQVVINESVRAEMRKILREIQTGEFAREWILENQAGRPVYNKLLEMEREHLIEKVGKELRKMMPWLREE